jgi:putative ABC transport system substrate-binding protein
MRRRDFLELLGIVAVVWPSIGEAQQQIPTIGVLLGTSVEGDPLLEERVAILRTSLQQLGWEEGRTLNIHWRFAADSSERLQTYVAELKSLKPDVIIAQSTQVISALREAVPSIPIVFVQISDPVNAGLVRSLSHPEGNLTGFTAFDAGFGAKWLELLKTIAPNILEVTALRNPDYLSTVGYMRQLEAAAAAFRIRLLPADVRSTSDIEQVITQLNKKAGMGLVALPDTTTLTHRKLIVGLTTQYRVPSIYWARYVAREGGLIGYGVETNDLYRKPALYVDRILRGAKVGDLPIEGPTRFTLGINLKTANELSLEVPPSLLARADEIIE